MVEDPRSLPSPVAVEHTYKVFAEPIIVSQAWLVHRRHTFIRKAGRKPESIKANHADHIDHIGAAAEGLGPPIV